MKHLKELDQKLNKPNTRSIDEEIPIVKDVILDSLMFTKTSKGADSIRFLILSEKILRSEGTLDLEDAEFETVKSVVDKNPAGYFSWAHGQVMLKMQEWERS